MTVPHGPAMLQRCDDVVRVVEHTMFAHGCAPS
jgi:hypothetical protein